MDQVDVACEQDNIFSRVLAVGFFEDSVGEESFIVGYCQIESSLN